MLPDEIETLGVAEIAKRWDEVMAFLKSASGERELAAGYLAIARVYEDSGRAVEAWLAYREASRQYARCAVMEKAKECEARASEVEKLACPAFVDDYDVQATFERLAMALFESARAWATESPSYEASKCIPVIAEREVFRGRLLNTISRGEDVPRACVLARCLGLDPQDLEVVLLLHHLETDARWDRAIRSLGREDFLPAPSVRLLCRFLSGCGMVTWDWAIRFQKESPLVRWGLVELISPAGEAREGWQLAQVRLGSVVSMFLAQTPYDELLREAGISEVRVEPLGKSNGPQKGVIQRWLRDGGKEGFVLLSCATEHEPLEDLKTCVEGKRLLRINISVGDRFHPLGSFVQGLLLSMLVGGIPVIVLTKPRLGVSRNQDEGQSLAIDISKWVKSFAVALRAYGKGGAIVAPKELEADLRRNIGSLYVCTYTRPSTARLEACLDNALKYEGLSNLDTRIKTAILASEVVDEDSIAEIVREMKALERSGLLDSENVVRKIVRSRATTEFLGFAELLNPNVGWEDLVLPDDVLVTLNEIITFARYRERVMVEWGFADKMPYGRSLSALFHGPPGTGKTLAACVLARELGVELYRIDLSQIVSKWVGETEKNLARIFDSASRTKALILFDEADSLFGKRTEVRTAVDRYSNLEVNYLLQRLEDFDGVAILTTNFPENIDPAFKRRIRFKVAFPFPDATLRARMWQTLIPGKVPRSGGFDFAYLGSAFEFSGAQIKNAILRACFVAASEDRALTQADLIEAAKTEAKEAGILVRG